MKIFFTATLLLSVFLGKAQQVTANLGLDSSSADRQAIITLWSNYLGSNPDVLTDNPYWSTKDKLVYKSYDLLKSEGFLSPSLYAFGLDNKILSISKLNGDYLIISVFYDRQSFDIYAITNVVATKENGRFVLTNYQPVLTANWKTKTVGLITYHYFPDYRFNEEKALQANAFLSKICSTMGLEKEKLDYFICRDCEDVFKVKGFDYVLSMGNATECGFFDSYNNIVYATQLAGENHQHELTHFINTYFPQAHELVLTGLSAYWGGENAHKGRPLIYSIKRVDDFLKSHPEIDLNQPQQFWKIDEETNPQYVIGAMLCELAAQKGGLAGLKKLLSCGKTDEALLSYIEKTLQIKKGSLNDYLRKKISGWALKKDFSPHLKLS